MNTLVLLKHPLLASTVHLPPSVKHKAEGEKGMSAGRKHAAVLQHMGRRAHRILATGAERERERDHTTAR